MSRLIITSTDTVTLELAGAITTNQPEYTATWIDDITDAPGASKGELNSTTPVTTISSPASGRRIIPAIWVCNLDTVSITVILRITGGTTRTIIRRVLEAGTSRELLTDLAEAGSTGTTDHTQLTNRSSADQHPISAITGLQTSLDAKAIAPITTTPNNIPQWDATQKTLKDGLAVTTTVVTPGTDTTVPTEKAVSTRLNKKVRIATSDPTVNDDNTQGYLVDDEWINKTNKRIFVCTSTSTGAAVWQKVQQDIVVMTTAPTANDDSNDGYAVNDLWADYTNRAIYVATDVTPGAAVWNSFALDLLAKLSQSEVSVISGGSLTSTAFGKMHACSCSTAYSLILPAASGNAGKFIGFRITSSSTAIVTIDGNGSETIGTKLTRPYIHDEVLIVMCDGSNWIVVQEFLIPVKCKVTATGTQAISTGSQTKVTLNTESYDDGGYFDSTTNYRYTPLAPGLYSIQFKVEWITIISNRYFEISVTHSTQGNQILYSFAYSLNGTNFTVNGGMNLTFNGSTEYLEAYVQHAMGATRSIQYPILEITRISNV